MWKLYLLGALLLALAGSAYTIQRQLKKNGAQAQIIKTQRATLDAYAIQSAKDVKLLQHRAKAEKLAQARAESARRELEDALRAHAAWSDTRVPEEVQDALTSKP